MRATSKECFPKSFTIETSEGFTVNILSLGAIITQIMAKDKHGQRSNVVLHYPKITDYEKNPFFLGCVVGPVAGRTQNGFIPVPNNPMKLDTSCHPNSLHSCGEGLHLVDWTLKSHTKDTLVLTHKSILNDFLKTSVNYTLTYKVSNEALTIDYLATVSHKTYLSLTNHSYFNLTGNPLFSEAMDSLMQGNAILDHILSLNCSHYAKINADSLPKALITLKGSDLDFTKPTLIRNIVTNGSDTVLATSGVDHPFKRAKAPHVATLLDPSSGRQMKVITTQPYTVIYTGNFLDSSVVSLSRYFGKYAGICFETQDLPNVLNNQLDEALWVTPEIPYVHQTIYDFSL